MRLRSWRLRSTHSRRERDAIAPPEESPRHLLISAVRERILSGLLSKGYVVTRDNASKRAFREDDGPEIDCRRIFDGGVDIINFQFDRQLRPAFVINAARSRGATTIDYEGNEVSPRKVVFFGLPEDVRLESMPPSRTGFFSRSWIGPSLLGRTFWKRASIQTAVDEALALLPQTFRYLEVGTIGPNLMVTRRWLTPEGKLASSRSYGE